ncbi:MAG: hypothetical protein ACOZBW_07625 [Thermodesulfobacteriota bacterium]
MAANFLICLSKSLSLSGSVSKSNLMYGEVLKNDSLSFLYPCTFLGGKKSTKRSAPRGLAFGFPRANVFSGAVRNSPACGGLKQPARVSRKNRLRSAAPQRAKTVINAHAAFLNLFPWGTLFLALFLKFVNSDGYKCKTPLKS